MEIIDWIQDLPRMTVSYKISSISLSSNEGGHRPRMGLYC